MPQALESISLHSLVGVVGVISIIAAYLLLTLGKISADALQYSLMNALGAFLIIVSLAVDFNLSAFLIEVFWLGISIFGIAKALSNRRLGARRRARRSADEEKQKR